MLTLAPQATVSSLSIPQSFEQWAVSLQTTYSYTWGTYSHFKPLFSVHITFS